MSSIRSLFFFSFVFQSLAFTAEVHYVKIKPDFFYKDLSIYCKTYQRQNDLLLAMEATDLKVSRARLRRNNAPAYEKSLELAGSEVAKIRLAVTSEGQIMLEALSLEAGSIAWILTHTGGGEMGCRPSGPIATMTPSSFIYLFESSENTFSNTGRFSGKLKNGDSFQAELQFRQSTL